MVFFQNIHNHVFKKNCTFLRVLNRLHLNKKILIKIKCRNNMNTGSNVNPNKKR